jgi:hypothetical protein
MQLVLNGTGSEQYYQSANQILGDRGQPLDVYQSSFGPNYVTTIRNPGLDMNYNSQPVLQADVCIRNPVICLGTVPPVNAHAPVIPVIPTIHVPQGIDCDPATTAAIPEPGTAYLLLGSLVLAGAAKQFRRLALR